MVTALRSVLDKAGWRLIGVHHDAPSIVKLVKLQKAIGITD